MADRRETGVGDAAKLREALEAIVGNCRGCAASWCDTTCKPGLSGKNIANALAALAAPSRNCDRTFVDRAAMYDEFRNWCNAKGHTMEPKLASDAFDWFLATAAKEMETIEKQARST